MLEQRLHVVEVRSFCRDAERLWSDADREAFVDFLIDNPDAGEVLPRTGGVRKLLWRQVASGKRTGTRVIYFHHGAGMPLFLLLIYATAPDDATTPAITKHAKICMAELERKYPGDGV